MLWHETTTNQLSFQHRETQANEVLRYNSKAVFSQKMQHKDKAIWTK